MKEHVKWSLLKKESLNLAKWFKSYPTLKFKISWQWFDHNLPTTNEKWMFLDILERWEQDLQLSCWTKFGLKLSWWFKFEEKTFPFLAVENYRSLLFLETFYLTSNFSMMMFDMLYESCMDMNETFPTISHPQILD